MKPLDVKYVCFTMCISMLFCLHFRSGPSAPPYDYNGFLITLEFRDKGTTTTESPPANLLTKTTEQTIMSKFNSQHPLWYRNTKSQAFP